MQKDIFENNSKIIYIPDNNSIISDNNLNKNNLEENSIKDLIKEIYELNQKISEINSTKEIDNNIEPKLKRINSLKNSKKNLENNISEIKNELSIELKKKEISQEHKKVLINEINQKVVDIKSKINLYSDNFSKFNSILLIKYIYINKIIDNNDFLSKEQVENILSEKNVLSNNVELKKIYKEKEVNIISQNIINKNIQEKKCQKLQYEENLKMLEEEKNGLSDELSDILSYKEYLEYGKQICIDNIKNNKINYNNNEGMNESIEILFDELVNIDSEKVAFKICEELYDLFIVNFQNENINNKHLNINENKSFILQSEIKNKRNDFFEFTKLNNSKSNDKNNKKNKSNNSSKAKINEKKESINMNIIKNNDKENLDKKMLKKLIQNEIDTFINTNKTSTGKNNNIYQDVDNNLLNDFLFNLSMIIINKIKNILSKSDNNLKNLHISSNNIIKYLSLFFKLFYYENLFDKNNIFINKDYNLIKKEINKKLIEIEKEKIKLEDKLNENKLKQKIDKALEELINKKNYSKEESKNSDEYSDFNLNKEEMAYIDLCKEFNDLLEQREKIKNDNDKNNINFINKKKDIEIKIDEYNSQIDEIQKEINDINEFIENYTSPNNKEIVKYRKIISEKINKIKIELNSYKNKYHDNIEKYNDFLEKINNIMKSLNLNNSFFSNNHNENENKDFIENGNPNSTKTIINYNNKYNNTNNKKIKNGYFNENKDSFINIDTKKLNKSMTIIKNKNNNKNLSFYDNSNNIENNSFLFKKQSLNNSKNIDEETKSNFNLPIKSKKQNIYNIYNISLLPNVINKNKSTTNIHAKIKEIKKLKNNKKIPISNKLFSSKNFSTFFSESMQQQPKLISNFDISNKNSFSQNKNTNNSNNEKLIPLKNSIICYLREISLEENKNTIKYNPLNNINLDILCSSPYNFTRAKMNLNENCDIINIKMYKNKMNYEIKIDEIENTVINSHIKKIIEIYRNYNKLKFKNNFSFEDFVNNEKNKFKEMSKEDIIKSALNQNFNFSLVTKNRKRFEFIIRSYEEFKIWINGLAFIIKNKKY